MFYLLYAPLSAIDVVVFCFNERQFNSLQLYITTVLQKYRTNQKNIFNLFICTERWVRTNDLVSMNHTLLPTELSRQKIKPFQPYCKLGIYVTPLAASPPHKLHIYTSQIFNILCNQDSIK